MADKITLIDARDWHRKCATMCRRTNEPALANLHDNMADALDAHIAAMGDPVAWMVGNDGEGMPAFVTTEPRVPWNYQVPLFTAPPASGDWDKVREVIAILDADGDEWGCAAKLTAALPESQS